MLKMRLGAVPETEVKMPQPLAKFEQPSPYDVCAIVAPERENRVVKRTYVGGAGKQADAKPPGSLIHHKIEPPIGVHVHTVKGLIVERNENGKATNVSPSSMWLPVSVSPGTIGSVPVVKM